MNTTRTHTVHAPTPVCTVVDPTTRQKLIVDGERQEYEARRIGPLTGLIVPAIAVPVMLGLVAVFCTGALAWINAPLTLRPGFFGTAVPTAIWVGIGVVVLSVGISFHRIPEYERRRDELRQWAAAHHAQPTARINEWDALNTAAITIADLRDHLTENSSWGTLNPNTGAQELTTATDALRYLTCTPPPKAPRTKRNRPIRTAYQASNESILNTCALADFYTALSDAHQAAYQLQLAAGDILPSRD
ncbi:hypothetical protein CIK75_02790 [Glutamicibacter sp. BW78]|uniref:hypothetical protein n=1 Tax=Glutamicibacter sp. BW78 TaxID=2024403 RepID=UPI000BB68EC5|nr:hypothetical protein [Glutamicibacter sp. BW78]PCC26507.1 hypothetical protein CIK75_02790 [Glutamicibacter sp. BW78]